MASPPWLHGQMKRTEAGKLIGDVDGTFLVSVSAKGTQVLSVVFKGKPTHHSIGQGDDGFLTVNQKNQGEFKTIEELIAGLGKKTKKWPVALITPIMASDGDTEAKPARPSITVEEAVPAVTAPAPAPAEPVAAQQGAAPTSAMTDEQLQRDLPGFEEDAPPPIVDDDAGVVVARHNLGGNSSNSHRVVAETSMHPDAATSASVYTSFLIDGDWSEPVLFFTGAKQGEVKSKEFDRDSKGKSIRFSIKSPEGPGTETWSYWRIEADGVEILRCPTGINGTPLGKDKYWIGERGQHCYLNNVLDLVPPEDDIAIAAKANLAIVNNPEEGAWKNTSRGYRRSSFVRKGSFKSQDFQMPQTEPLLKSDTAQKQRLSTVVKQLFCAQHLLPTEEHEKLVMSPEDQAIRFNMADVYHELKDAGALSSSRISGAFDLAGTYSRADQEGAGEVNLWQFVGALDAQHEVEAVARAAAARSRHQAVVEAEKAVREAERRRQEQQRASFDEVAIERQMREQMHLEEQAVLFAQQEERQRQQAEYAEKQKVEELRQKAEAAKRKAQNRRLWQAQQFLMPWEVTQHSK